MRSDSDEQPRMVLFTLLLVVVLTTGGVVGLGILKVRGVSDKTTLTADVMVEVQTVATQVDADAQAAEPAIEDASIVVEDGVVTFYFASGSAHLAAGVGAALDEFVAAAKAGQFVVLSGFHDETGNATFNAELAKRRAIAVRTSLLMAGAPQGRVVMKNPEVLTGSGSNAQARRVEVVISDRHASSP